MPTPLELLFASRLREEMEERKISAAGLARAAKGRGFNLSQRTISRVLLAKQDPTLSKVYEIAQTLDIPIKTLLANGVEKPLHNVVVLPSPYRKIMSKKSQSDIGKPKTGKKLPIKR